MGDNLSKKAGFYKEACLWIIGLTSPFCYKAESLIVVISDKSEQ